MNKTLLVAGNWKMNKGLKESEDFLSQLSKNVSEAQQKQVLLFPQSPLLYAMSLQLKNTKIRFGSQNVYHEEQGAYTGEISPLLLKELRASASLVGHSERREIFKETDEEIALKVRSLQNQNLIPIFCIGESLEQREAGNTFKILEQQLKIGLQHLDLSKEIVIAYEPVWAIGTGKVATPEIAQEAHAFIRSFLKESWGAEFADSISLLYGGSVKPDNAKELGAQEDINGFLIGGASLDVDSFTEIISYCGA